MYHVQGFSLVTPLGTPSIVEIKANHLDPLSQLSTSQILYISEGCPVHYLRVWVFGLSRLSAKFCESRIKVRMRFSWILMAWVWLMESAAWLGKPRLAVSRCFLVAKLRHWKERVTFQNLFILRILDDFRWFKHLQMRRWPRKKGISSRKGINKEINLHTKSI